MVSGEVETATKSFDEMVEEAHCDDERLWMIIKIVFGIALITVAGFAVIGVFAVVAWAS